MEGFAAYMEKKPTRSLQELPNDVLLEIILRIPVESLERLRFASKFWYELLSDLNVIDAHFLCAKQNPGYLCVAFIPRGKISLEFKRDYDRCICYVEMRDSRAPLARMLTSLNLLGSGGGLMACEHYDNCVYIINPIIGERIRVPLCMDKNFDVDFYVQTRKAWGFAYSLLTKEYKLVKVCSGRGPIWGAIYTLGCESWRELPYVPYEPIGRGIDCDGTLFWIIGEIPENSTTKHVMSFDIVSEEFKSWTLPPDAFLEKDVYLTRIGDSVGYVACKLSKILRVWILREDAWTNEYNVVGMENFTFLEQWVGIEVFAEKENKLYSYNVVSGEYRAIRSNFGSYRPLFNWGHLHVGSLVSPLRIVADAKLSLIKD